MMYTKCREDVHGSTCKKRTREEKFADYDGWAAEKNLLYPSGLDSIDAAGRYLVR